MSAFPSYDAQLLRELEAQTAAVLSVFTSRGYVRVEPPILQPADMFVERSGEEIRRRTFLMDDALGRELCLRPDLTIPVCRMHIESGGAWPARLAYHGPVFRLQASEPQRPAQFLQTGVECLGAADRDATDGEVLALAVEAARASGLRRFSVRVGDVALFSALVDELDLPAQWRRRLTRHFWRPEYFSELLTRLAQPRLSTGETRAVLEAKLDALGDVPFGGRTREEIIDRLLEQNAEESAVQLDAKALALMEKVLSVAGNAEKAIASIRALAREASIALNAPLAELESRLAMLRSLGLHGDSVSFAARFGRNMEYYTGFVFELWSRDSEGPVQVAGGGRYDTLLRGLGASQDEPAVGCALRPERLLAAKRAGGVQ